MFPKYAKPLAGLSLLLVLPAEGAAQTGHTVEQIQELTAKWPESARKAAAEMMRKYGAPDQVTPHILIWHENGPWKWTTVSGSEILHNFPTPHSDVIEQAVNYNLPLDRYDDIATFDGSVMAERTKGEISARCDMEGANFLALNLAHEIASGRRSIDAAGTYFARAVAAYKQDGRIDPYMQRLTFTPPETAGDPGKRAF